jgi:hypothetical protein
MMSKRQQAISATIEAYRDKLVPADTARVILEGLRADPRSIATLEHGWQRALQKEAQS